MQVLLITVILAGITTMILRANLSRTASARKTRRQASAQVLIQACMSRVNDLWTAKSPDAFRRDMKDGIMYCKGSNPSLACPAADQVKSIVCEFGKFKVTATIEPDATKESANNGGLRAIVYEVTTGSNFL